MSICSYFTNSARTKASFRMYFCYLLKDVHDKCVPSTIAYSTLPRLVGDQALCKNSTSKEYLSLN